MIYASLLRIFCKSVWADFSKNLEAWAIFQIFQEIQNEFSVFFTIYFRKFKIKFKSTFRNGVKVNRSNF